VLELYPVLEVTHTFQRVTHFLPKCTNMFLQIICLYVVQSVQRSRY